MEVAGPEEVADILGVSIDDLSCFPFGANGLMVMSRKAQLADDSLSNKSASVVLEKAAGVMCDIRGAVVVFPAKPPWFRLSV